ncbi:N-formylglutamate amidohydrolase [Rhizobium skierniewicense]|uniref:N-formylglutamate amidohydrolase n=1 Tax=Rhizobium skierniewicense TaxID=984260 RepID=A0A7W6C3X9_9HYPH|nr:N-formylglutamate amidohydrolase [Rhizobium skierniewicense]MBB3945278.1 N-formylglutamate amidohydrolase [Rhizobium skierniewicense]NTF33092.1 N-formylglutamate amidohydrolase [Rhizobium skierniewicense]
MTEFSISPLEMDGVLSIIPATAPAIPMVFDSPHSGLAIPKHFEKIASDDLVLVASDTYVDDLFDFAPAIGAPMLLAHFPRSFLDLNRSLEDVDLELVDGTWPHAVRESASARRGMGLIWRFAWGDQPMYDRKLSVAELENRIDTYWRPYHRALVHLLDTTYDTFDRVYHVNCHSMPAFGHVLSPDPAGTIRKDIVIGDYDGTSSEPDFVQLVIKTLESFGYSVSLNVPFRGAELVSAYNTPAKNRHSIQIELNRSLYMDEVTREKNAGYSELKENLARLGTVLKDYVKSGEP